MNPLVQQHIRKEKVELQALVYVNIVKTQKAVEPIVLELWKATERQLRHKLRDPSPLLRWFAADILSRKQIHVEKELIPLLDDPYVEVRKAAHEALVRLGRSTDFGPSRHAGRREIREAMDRWNDWLRLQVPIATGPSLDPSMFEYRLDRRKGTPRPEPKPR